MAGRGGEEVKSKKKEKVSSFKIYKRGKNDTKPYITAIDLHYSKNIYLM